MGRSARATSIPTPASPSARATARTSTSARAFRAPFRRRSPSTRFRCASRTGSSRSRWRERSRSLLGEQGSRLQRLPRRGVGPAGSRRARVTRAALSRRLPVRALLADDPAQARELPRRLCRLRPGGRRPLRRARREAAARRRRHRPPPRQDRSRDRQRARDPRAARSRHAAARARLGVPARRPGAERVLSLEHDPRKCEAWRRNVADAGLDDCAELIEGDAHETLPAIDDVFDVVFLDAEKEDYERLFLLARGKVEAGALFVADNVLSHVDALGAYSRARQGDPSLESVTVPLDRGLELSVVIG